MYVTRIKMKKRCYYSSSAWEISEIYIEGCSNLGCFAKEVFHDYLKENPDSAAPYSVEEMAQLLTLTQNEPIAVNWCQHTLSRI